MVAPRGGRSTGRVSIDSVRFAVQFRIGGPLIPFQFRRYGLDLRQLKYFIAVAEEQHFGRAALKLHLSQPPLTRQIQALETELDTALFERTSRGLVLTQAGQVLLEDARMIRALTEQARDRAQRAGSGQLGHLHLGVYGSAIFGVVPHVLKRFCQRHPDVELTLHQAQTPAQVAALRQRRVHAFFERQMPDEEDIAAELVARERLWVAMSESHALAGLDEVPVQALQGETIVTGNATTAIAQVIELCRAHGFEAKLAPPMSDVVVATLLAASGPALSLVPSSMLNVKFPGVAYRALRSQTAVSMDLHCFYLRGERSPLLLSLLGTVRRFCQESGESTTD
jgi:LysR family transcriptional regulator, benzoate and cis,cis-muconate-responsive activator of ben and cat genes